MKEFETGLHNLRKQKGDLHTQFLHLGRPEIFKEAIKASNEADEQIQKIMNALDGFMFTAEETYELAGNFYRDLHLKQRGEYTRLESQTFLFNQEFKKVSQLEEHIKKLNNLGFIDRVKFLLGFTV